VSFYAFVAYFVYGGILFGLLPWLRTEFAKYPAVYRSQEGIRSVMPFGMLAMFVALNAIAVLYAMVYSGGSGLVEGALSSGSSPSAPSSCTTTST
jgi:hypothetical protein